MASISFSSAPASYRLDELGWLQFERVCSLLLKADAGLDDVLWTGQADTERLAMVDGPVIFATLGLRLEGPVTVIVVWVAEDDSQERRLGSLVQRAAGLGFRGSGWWCSPISMGPQLGSRWSERRGRTIGPWPCGGSVSSGRVWIVTRAFEQRCRPCSDREI